MSLVVAAAIALFLAVLSTEAKLVNVALVSANQLDDESMDSSNQERINLSVPGTKWCGPGNTAANYDDLGNQKEVDMCCRDHDHCDNIAAGETKYNLTNRDFFTVLNCDCDKEFKECLHKINSKMSNRIGRLYFTLRNHCYYDTNPVIECDEYDTEVFLRRCIHYKLDERQPKRYQWFDLPLYDGKSERDAMNDDIYDL